MSGWVVHWGETMSKEGSLDAASPIAGSRKISCEWSFLGSSIEHEA